MPGLVSFFLRLIREDGRRYRLIARRHHGVGGLRRFHRRMQAIRRFGRDAAGRGYHGTRRDARGGYYTSGSGLHAAGCAHRGAPRARGPTPMGFDPSLVAGPSAPAVHEDAAAPAPPPGSLPPPPPPPTAWMAPLTPTPAAETAGPSRGPPGYVPAPMRALVDEEPRHRWKRPWARAAARRGVSADSSGAPSPPSTAVPAAALSRGPRRASDSPAPRQRLRARTPSSSDLLRKTRARRGCAGDHRSRKGMRRPLLPAGAAVWQWGSSRGGAGVRYSDPYPIHPLPVSLMRCGGEWAGQRPGRPRPRRPRRLPTPLCGAAAPWAGQTIFFLCFRNISTNYCICAILDYV
ncbi:hypothetical protein ZWY2020_039733 [Hordeum vulgare]|nr:hypothetical protein ZWY2020_039733 [Hordeum vulgare]